MGKHFARAPKFSRNNMVHTDKNYVLETAKEDIKKKNRNFMMATNKEEEVKKNPLELKEAVVDHDKYADDAFDIVDEKRRTFDSRRFIHNHSKDILKKKENFAKEELADEIASRLEYDAGLSKEEAMKLKETIENTFEGYKINLGEGERKSKSVIDINLDYLDKFIASKRIEGKSYNTIYNYGHEISKGLRFINKPVVEITADDIRQYMDYRSVHDGVASVTVQNIRMYFMSFFKWLVQEEYLLRNPMDKISKVKSPKRVVQTLTDEEIEIVRCACTSERDLAIVDVLAGSGMRVGELCRLNREDVDFETGEMKVYGKGAKERICYLTGRAKVHLRWYLNERTDDNPALFVTNRKPFHRLTKTGVEYALRCIARRTGIPKLRLNPHKFRSTLATSMINKGADVSKIQAILGHQSPETTIQVYANMANDTIKQAHHQYVL